MDESAARTLGLYLHIPFCERKCPYCDFNTYAGLDALFEDYVEALCRELDDWAPRLEGALVDTIFIGGGTPTVLSVGQLERILSTVRRAFVLAPGCEISCEANPGTVDRAKFRGLVDLGVNRLSMGAQSFQAAELGFLGRIHDADDVARAYEAARAAGFTNINLDFMFGLPHQHPEDWHATLERAIELAPEHLSLYSLIVEAGTPLFGWVHSGQVDAPDEDEAATLYEAALARLAEAGYVHYEVSNWARDDGQALGDGQSPALACRHNLRYWRNEAYLGVGPGAHSHLWSGETDGPARGRRWGNRKPVPGYIQRLRDGRSVEASSEWIEAPVAMGETMMLGLRLVCEGVPLAAFRARFGVDLREVYAEPLTRLTDWALVTTDEERVRLTRRGLLVGNQVFGEFLPGTA